MKYMNIIKLLSVLLCIGMLFVACDSAKNDETQATDTATEAGTVAEAESDTSTEAPTEAPTEEPLLENVEDKFENFFEIIKDEENAAISDAERIDGEVVDWDSGVRFILMKSSDVDTMNTVTDTFKLYNMLSGEITLTVENKYFNGDYDAFDWDDIMVKKTFTFEASGNGYVQKDSTLKYPESIVEVEINEAGRVPYVLVKEAKITPMDEATAAANPEACAYVIVTTYTYYDVYGNKITSAPDQLYVSNLINYRETLSVLFGTTVAYFDAETLMPLGSSSAVNDLISNIYDHETDAYGYFLNGENNVAALGTVYYFDVIDKASGETAYRYYLDNNYEIAKTFVLHNGDILIQYENEVEEKDSYDYAIDAEEFYDIAHFIFSVKDGSVTEIDLPYCIQYMMDGETFSEALYLEDQGLATTANARNVAIVNYIGDGIYEDGDLVVFDNDMSVLFKLDRIVPEHKIEADVALGITILANGDYLVELDDVVTDRAIVTRDGKVRAYLTSDMKVYGNYVVKDSNVYDYDLNHICDLDEESYKVVGEIFGELIVAEDGVDLELEYAKCCIFKVDNDGKASFERLFGDDVKLVEITDEYVIIQREEDDKYILYNEEFESILVTYDSMSVVEFNDSYIVTTHIKGEVILYELN